MQRAEYPVFTNPRKCGSLTDSTSSVKLLARGRGDLFARILLVASKKQKPQLYLLHPPSSQDLATRRHAGRTGVSYSDSLRREGTVRTVDESVAKDRAARIGLRAGDAAGLVMKTFTAALPVVVHGGSH
jgi:hypothetical protein